MKIARIELELHWGFSVRPFPGSASQPSYLVPPLTTVFGALARAYSWCFEKSFAEIRLESGRVVSATKKFIDAFGAPYVAIGLFSGEGEDEEAPPLVRVSQIVRTFTGHYQAKVNIDQWAQRRVLSEAFGPYSFGYTMCNHGRMYLYIAPENGVEIPRCCLWSLTRLGSKESIVSVNRVDTLQCTELEEVESGTVENVIASFFREWCEPVDPYYIEETTLAPESVDDWIHLLSLSIETRFVPPQKLVVVPRKPIAVEVKRRVRVCRLEIDGKIFSLIIPGERS
ncbi:MAG: type I-A CRISPR-associated protein Cas5 [Crenarchaeota archaeon]|nr:type I-A CRISPR-associated protein Cas5 [Thermoproteota archaeon]